MRLCDQSAWTLAELLRKKEISSRDITESVLERIHEKEETLNAFITTTQKSALKQADEADRRLRKGAPLSNLDGIPIAVKDNLCTRGITTTCASHILNRYIPSYNATAVDKVLSAGGVLVGKTNLDEFGMGSSGEKSIIGPTRNPVNPEYVSGGSSGGSAAAVAAGETILALGTDTGGSIRQPACFCGVVGIKPTYGRVSRYGLISYASSLDQIGALGRSVKDCALLINCICGHDNKDSTSAAVPAPNVLPALNKGVEGLRIGLPREYFVEGIDPGMKERIMEAVGLMEKNGGRVMEVSLPHSKYAVSAYYLIATAEASSNLARYDGVKYGFRSHKDVPDSIKMIEETRSEGFGKEVKRRIMLGSYVLSAGYYDAYYLKAQKVRTLIKEDFDKAFEHVDCLIAPVTPCLPFKLGEKLVDPLQMYLVDIYSVSLNLSGLPGMGINCGTVNGLPVGFQVIGKAFDEETVIQVGHAYEVLAKKTMTG